MKNLKKLVLVGISAVITASLFTGCSYEGNKLSDAFTQTKKITSLETKSDLGIRFSAENLSPKEQTQMNAVIPMINNAKMTTNSKINQSGDGKTAKMQSDVTVQSGNIPMNMAVWVDVNDTNQVKEIFKMPPALNAQMNGKDYLVLDTSKMGVENNNSADFQKTVGDMQKKLSDIMLKNMANFNPSFNLVTDKGTSSVTSPDGVKSVEVYEINLNDKNFKNLIKYSSNNLLANKDLRDLVKDYLISVTKLSTLNADESKAKQTEIDKSFSDFEKGLPQFTDQMNKVLNSFDNLAIIGEKGIVIDYSVDRNGYIVNEKGNMDFVFDAPKFVDVIDSLNGTTTPNKPTGLYKLGIDFNTTTFNIDKSVEVKFPELNSSNSVQFQDLMNQTKTETKTK